MLLNEDDSDGSSQPEDEGSEDGETDDHSQEDYILGDEQLERRATTSGTPRLAPPSMQWAIRNRDTNRSSVRLSTTGSSLVFIDPSALRRTTTTSAAVAAAQEPHTMSTTAASLARAFGIVLRQVCQLFNTVNELYASGMLHNMNLTYQEANELHVSVCFASVELLPIELHELKFMSSSSLQMALEIRLKPTWDWILNVMDATEAQLRFGASLTNSTDASHPLHPLHLNPNQPPATSATSSTLSGISVLGGSSQPRARLLDTQPPGSSTRIVGFSSNTDNQRSFERENYAQSSRRVEFLTYALSLMRSHSSEHRDSLPVLDITALRHIAYVLDGMVFYMRSAKENDIDKSESSYWADADENENDDTEDELQMTCDNDSIDDDLLTSTNAGRHTFFQRSESTLCLGCPPPDPFNTPMNEALPLADQPHLLQPNACREDLFGIPKQPITIPSNNVDPPGMNSPLELPPTRLGLSSSPRNAANAATVAHLASQYEYTYAEQTAVIEDQPMAVDESKDATEPKSDLPEMQGTASATTEQSLPGTSKESGGNSSWRQPESFNIFMQLKKKTYFDFHDGDSKSRRPNKDVNVNKMELDSDHDDLTDSESDGRSLPTTESSADDNQSASGSSSAVRPQIIVTPRKATPVSNDASKTGTTSAFNVFGSGHTDVAGASTSSGAGSSEANLSVIAQSVHTAGSPSKSVIVRAGPSVSNQMTIPSTPYVLRIFKYGSKIPD